MKCLFIRTLSICLLITVQLNCIAQDTLKTISIQNRRRGPNFLYGGSITAFNGIKPYLMQIPETFPELHKVKFALLSELTSIGLLLATESIGSIVWHTNPNKGYSIEEIGIIPVSTSIYFAASRYFHIKRAIKIYNKRIPHF